jgi:hypothetical protein
MKVEVSGGFASPDLVGYARHCLMHFAQSSASVIELAVFRLRLRGNIWSGKRPHCHVVVRLTWGLYVFHETHADTIHLAIDQAASGVGRIVRSVEARRGGTAAVW